MPELVSRTPKLGWFFRLSDDAVTPSERLAGPPGIEPGLSVLETDVLPLYDGPVHER